VASVPSSDDPPDLPPALVTDLPVRRCEWCGRTLGEEAAARSLAVDVGRRVHRYLPAEYRVCDDRCRRETVSFVRRHLRLGPPVWTVTVLVFGAGLAVLAALLPPPFRLLSISPDGLLSLVGILGLLALAAGLLVTTLPYTFIARRPQGDPPAVPLRRARTFNRGLGLAMTAFALILLLRAALGS
jgi:hypothetical protein